VDDSSPANTRPTLTEAMDIFSLGCVIGELFTDGRQLFDLSQLLELRSKQGEYSPEILLKKIADKPVRVSPFTKHSGTSE
jgi:phosphoinositide-3-kinase regulatory subunit 4